MFYTLDGRATYNEVRASHAPPPTKPAPRGVDYGSVFRLLEAMPDCYRGPRQRPNLNKLRAAVIAFTGFPPGVLQKLGSRDINLESGIAYVGRRLKGGGVEARVIHLQPPAIAAFRALIAAGGIDRRWSRNALNAAVKRAILRPGVNLPADFCVYDLRHSFGSELLRACGDEATVARALLHAVGSRETHRYTLTAHADADAAAAATMAAALSRVPAPGQVKTSQNVPAKRARKDNLFQMNNLTV